MEPRIVGVGKDASAERLLLAGLRSIGHSPVKRNPEIVVSLGGDGSLLKAERLYPGVPKLPVRDRSICEKCGDGRLGALLNAALSGKLAVKEYGKLEGRVLRKGRPVFRGMAANDVVVRNDKPYHALRFSLRINSRPVDGIMVGDGIVVSTSFGSTGYFHSVTGRHFKEGLVGVAFNNPMRGRAPVIGKALRVRLKIERNPAVVCLDNDRRIFLAREGDVVEARPSKGKLRILGGWTFGNGKEP